MTVDLQRRVISSVRDVPDFPRPGVLFKDITPLLADTLLLPEVVAAMAAPFRDSQVTHVVGVESRGFLFGVPIALALRASFVPARKPGKLPRPTVHEPYALEYGTDELAIHGDAVPPGAKVLIVDDVLATGGTAAACCRIVERMAAEIVAVCVLLEISALGGRGQLQPWKVDALVRY